MKKALIDFDDAELGAHYRARHHHLAKAHAAGLIDEHPATTWNKQAKAARDTRDSLPGNVASSKPILLEGDPEQTQALGEDDPIPTPQTPAVPERNGGTTAVDSAVLEELAIRRSGHSNPEEAIRQARLRRNGSTPASVRATASLIDGYLRLK